MIIIQNIYSESANLNIKNADRNSVNSECFLLSICLKSLTVIITHTNRCPAHRCGHQPAGIPGAGRRPSRPEGLGGKEVNQESISRSLLQWASKVARSTHSQDTFRDSFQTKPVTCRWRVSNGGIKTKIVFCLPLKVLPGQFFATYLRQGRGEYSQW